MHVDFPVSRRRPRPHRAGRTTTAHVRDLIEQVLFTAPGERVNRPDFGTRPAAARLRAEQRRAGGHAPAAGAGRAAAVARRADPRRGRRRREPTTRRSRSTCATRVLAHAARRRRRELHAEVPHDAAQYVCQAPSRVDALRDAALVSPPRLLNGIDFLEVAAEPAAARRALRARPRRSCRRRR